MTVRRQVLITVSGTIAPDTAEQLQAGLRPRPDYVALAAAVDGDVVDVAEARRRTGRLGWVLQRLGGPALLLAWVCFRERRRYDAVFTDGEQVGLPLALLCRLTGRRPFAHVMVVHILSPKKKSLLFRSFRLGRYIDTMVVYSSAQADYIAQRLRFPADRIARTTFMVDTEFFSPERVVSRPDSMICAAGLELRDYPTLMAAVDGLDVRLVIAAASPWSRRADSTERARAVPSNVDVCSLGFTDLRQLYADARFVVMPLYENDFQAGITTILEAMAMSRAVVCSRTTGQTDTIVDGRTGVYVPPGDVDALRTAIKRLLDDRDAAVRMGVEARRFVVEHADVIRYAAHLADLTNAAAERHRRERGPERGLARR
jgi:glycosyltransferase involved in cell wall biosynthesis